MPGAKKLNKDIVEKHKPTQPGQHWAAQIRESARTRPPRQCKQLRRTRTPWHEKRPQQRASSQSGAAEEWGESKLAFPADPAGSDQRARWNHFIWHKRPFRTRARAATADAKGPLKRPPMGDPQAIHPRG